MSDVYATKEQRSLQTGFVLVFLEIALSALVYAEPGGHSNWYIVLCGISAAMIYIIVVRFILSFSYIEKEWRPLGIVVVFTIVSVASIIFLFAILYRWTEIKGESAVADCVSDLTECIYFSVITITTVGYGDYHPFNLSGRIVASAEALSGLVLLGVLIASLSNMLRARDVARGR
jgi:Ion channel